MLVRIAAALEVRGANSASPSPLYGGPATCLASKHAPELSREVVYRAFERFKRKNSLT